MKKIEELTLRFLDDELSDEEVDELEELIDADDDGREIFVGLVEQEAALRGGIEGQELSDATIRQIRQQLSARIEEDVMKTVRKNDEITDTSDVGTSDLTDPIAPVEKLSPWFGRRLVYIGMAAAALLLVVYSFEPVQVRLEPVAEHELHVFGHDKATPGLKTAYRAYVQNGRTGEALGNVETRFRLVDDTGRAVWEEEVRTDDDGLALVEPNIPEDLTEGSYNLEVRADHDSAPLEVNRTLQIKRSFKLFLSTDKPRYQPGQVIHIRSLSLYAMDRRPVGERDVTISVRDGRGNKVFNKRLKTSDFGLASADFQLAQEVNMGEFNIEATIGDTTSKRSVTVERYRLPRFRIELSTDKSYYLPGDRVSGELTARYTYGEPVSRAKISLVASEFVETFRPFKTIEGETDDEGVFRFELPLKEHFVGQPLKQGDGMVSFEAEVTDRAQYSQKRTLERTVTTTAIRVDVVPESGELVPGVENTLYFVTSSPDGRPVKARITLDQTGAVVQTDEAGFGELRWPAASPSTLSLTVVDEVGRETKLQESLPVDARGNEGVLLRTDRAIYRAGDSAQLSVLTASAASRVFIDVVKDRQTVMTSAIDIDEGRGELILDLPPELSGTLALTCYRLLRDGEIVSDTKLIQVAEAQDLNVVATLDRGDEESYRPAETATLQLQVLRDEDPTVAALSLWGVDEAVFALEEARPGLERVYFALQEELLEPRYEIHGHLSPSSLVDGPDDRSDANATVVLAAAQGIEGPAGSSAGSYLERLQDHVRRVERSMRGVWSIVVLSPSILFFFLVLPILFYGVMRIIRRTSLEGADELKVSALRSSMRWFVVFWAIGFWLPLLGATLTVPMVGYRHQEEAAAIAGGGFSIATVIVLFLLARSIRRRALSHVFPVLRRMVGIAPWAYLCWIVAVIFMFVGTEGVRILHHDTPVLVMLAMGVLVAFASGALALAGASVLRSLSTMRILWIGASRTVLAALPLLFLLPFLILSGANVASMDEMVAEPAMAERRMMAVAQDGLEQEFASRSAHGDVPLKAPARVRRHFPETLLWQPEVITDAQGRATVEVPLADSITTWRVGVGAVSADGLLGSSTVGIRVFQPFFVDVDLPVALTQNDEVQLRVGVYNYLNTSQTVRIDLDASNWLEVRGGGRSRTLNLEPREITQVSFPVVARRPGEHPVTIRAFGSEMADAVERRVRVEPDGQPVIDTRNGELSQTVTEDFTVPAEAIDGANALALKIYPGAFSQVVEGLDGILRMPSGCFEQTSSATYPNVLVLDYMRRNRQANAEVEMRALEYINTGYQRLLSFEVEGGGFDWFGNPPAHTVLTAYGLMEFTDMAEVFDVDREVIDRTRRWLLSQQQSDGSFRPPEGGIAEGAINQYQGQVLRTTAYIAWALAESGDRDSGLDRAIAYVESNIGDEDDPYTLAVAANALIASGRDGEVILRRLDGLKQRDGNLVHWSSEGEGATHSRGESLAMETTAIAAYAYLQARFATDTAHAALAWLVTNKDSFGTWQSTQATVHSMRALLLGAGGSADVEGEITIDVLVNGERAESVTVTEETADVFHTILLNDHVRIGQNRVTLNVSGSGNLAYQLVAKHYIPRSEGERSEQEPLSIEVSYDTTSLSSGDLLTANATVAYNREGTAQMTLVDLGIPPGFELQTQAFDALQEAGQIERYTSTGRQVILYFRELPRGEPVSFQYQMRAQYPLRVQTPRSAAYQYYEPEVRDETEPVELTVR